MFDYRRSHTCAALRKTDIGENVTLSGWVDRRRDHGGFIFIDLRDRFGITQLVINPQKNAKAHELAEKLRSEWVISIKGKVISRAPGMANPKIDTGDIEIDVLDLQVLSKAKTPPFSICDESIDVNEELRLKYRYLDIRRGEVAKKLITRHKAMLATRQFLDSVGFIEITTPILGKSTPEGARDYLVPSRVHPENFYALPQSPQIYKQLLMVAGMDRYFQIAQCFRDEDLRADRQPEFTQIDMEISFGHPTDLMQIVEKLVAILFKECNGLNIATPFRHIPHCVCMDRYGCDRPDLRFDMELVQINDIAKKTTFSIFLDQLNANGLIKALTVKGGADISRKGIEEYTEFVQRLGIKGLAWLKMQDGVLTSSIAKYFPDEVQQELIKKTNAEDGDLIFMIADQASKTNQGLDHLRRRIAKDRHLIDQKRCEFLWVTDFPLFNWDNDNQRLASEHHPFTSPHPEDIDLIDTDPLKMRSSGYDLVLNGYEIGGGSQRIHNGDLQKKIFEKLNLTEEQLKTNFGFFIEALSYGTPPHLGLALGLDRLIMILTETDNIRDVIAFPKTQRASDLMMDCPSTVSHTQLKELHISTDVPEAIYF